MNKDVFLRRIIVSYLESLKADGSSPPDAGDKAYIELKSWIFNHPLNPGQKLIYSDLADQLGMSKTPIIEALKRLEYDGFVVRKPKRGYFIKGIDQEELSDLMETREAIEVFLMEKVNENFTEKDYKELDKIRGYHGQFDYSNMPESLILDGTFHLRMGYIAKNKRLFKILRSLYEHIFLAFRYKPLPISWKRVFEKQHRELLEAIRNKDIKNAKGLIRDHIRSGMSVISESRERPIFKP